MANHTGSKTEWDGNAEVRASDNTARRCQARRPGKLLEAVCEHGPRGMAVTYRLRKQAVPYGNPLTGWLISFAKAFSKKTRVAPLEIKDSARTRPEPLAILAGLIRLLMG